MQLVPFVDRRVDQCVRASKPGVVDHDVDAAEPQRGVEEGCVDRSFVGHVEFDGERAFRPEVRGDLLGAVGVDVGDDHARAFGGESLGDRSPDARRGTGHQRDTSGEGVWGRPAPELRLFELPVLHAELLGVVDGPVRRHRFGAPHHVDRVHEELAGDTCLLCVGAEAPHPDAREEHDDRIVTAHRR